MEIRRQAEKADRFRQLHHGPQVLVLVNVWDVATARLVEEAGLRAIATSSAAVANSWGYPDGQRISRADMLSVVERIARHVQLPVSADLEAGYGGTDEAVTELAYAMIAAGAVGLNFEDRTGDARHPLFPVEEQVKRIKRLREVSSAIHVPVVINARTDVYLAQVGEPAMRFEHAVRRANAYRQAGADCLFVPGVGDGETIGRLVKAVEGPLNILAGPGTPPITELARLGVARISFGSGPFRAAMGYFRKFLHKVREPGAMAALAEDAIPYSGLNELFED
jgi:2-methylisocitrate lyase-like PEP mutase family enzyme